MKTDHLLKQLQQLRVRLYDLAEQRGSLTDPEVIQVSEEADRLIVMLQLLQRQSHSTAFNGSKQKQGNY